VGRRMKVDVFVPGRPTTNLEIGRNEGCREVLIFESTPLSDVSEIRLSQSLAKMPQLPDGPTGPPAQQLASRILFGPESSSRRVTTKIGAYLKRAGVAASYPIRGIWYFLRHRELHPLFFGRLLPLSIISFLVYFILFTFTFLPQFAFLAIFHGWGAWVNTVVLVLGEGLVITQVGAPSLS